MQIDKTVTDEMAVLRCEGRLTMVAAPALRSAVEECVAAGQRHVVVDLSPTSFVDSSGLGALVNGLKSARVAGGDLRIAGAPDQVRSVLRLTNLDRVLKPYADVDEARDGW
ncbi:STAS domain-containing protein [Nocardioides daphniae]|uniref:Anti-sigma factor antagonist n=1 Tax=Nocardioides daphniae TaxID=402297 RepID=A0A4P7UG31_9ACTN|nr:STAS domain-containing protein [Nocardioides daphniae]QCC77729.1 anti-sigma factor antagonist [Nocardioides daphniae]GGD29020.1 anti-sigma factor antagonist [Nocardioides daphniae]